MALQSLSFYSFKLMKITAKTTTKINTPITSISMYICHSCSCRFWFGAVVGCNKLKDTEWFSKQDPYVYLEYSSAKYRTKTCTGLYQILCRIWIQTKSFFFFFTFFWFYLYIDGGKNPTFNHKFKLELIEGYVEIKIMVWNENRVSSDTFIGSGR